MELLKDSFYGRGSVSGYLFKKIVSTPSVYIYRVESSVGTVLYDVFKRKKRRIFSNGEYISEEREFYPRDEDFGSTAFTYKSMAEAYDKAMDIINRYEEYE